MLQDRLALDPSDADALELLAEVAAGQRSTEEATILLRRAVAADPSPQRRIRVDLPSAAPCPRGRPGRNRTTAAERAQRIRGPRGRGDDRRHSRQYDRQIALYRAMARERSGEAGLWVNLGNALKTVGRTGEAVKALQRAIRANPAHGRRLVELSANFKSFKFSPGDLGRMQAALRSRPGEHDALHIQFALGKAFEDRREYEQSFRHYAIGNAMRAATFGPDQVAVTDHVDESLSTITADFFERLEGSGCPDDGPIFVVGLHRSGSTLIEQILASHPQVEGTTELPDNEEHPGPARALQRQVSAGGDRRSAARGRARNRRGISASRARLPANRPALFRRQDAVQLDEPCAHPRSASQCPNRRRPPPPDGVRLFQLQTELRDSGLGFSYDLEWIGAFYRDYWRFMRHFDAVQPGVVCRMINERLIDDPEAEVRRMLDHLGLPFDPACLEFHKNERAVPHAERRAGAPPHQPRRRRASWRHYEPWLGPLEAIARPGARGLGRLTQREGARQFPASPNSSLRTPELRKPRARPCGMSASYRARPVAPEAAAEAEAAEPDRSPSPGSSIRPGTSASPEVAAAAAVAEAVVVAEAEAARS